MSRRAALVSRLAWTSRSSTSPSLSTARHRYIRRPWIETTILSKCQVPVGLGRSRRRLRANMGPTFRTQRRTVSYEVSMPRSAKHVADGAIHVYPDGPGPEAVRHANDPTDVLSPEARCQ